MMKKSVIIAVLLMMIIGITLVFMNRYMSTDDSIFLDECRSESYYSSINQVELSEHMIEAVKCYDEENFENNIFKIKMAVLENEIPKEQDDKLLKLVKEYGVGETLIGYDFVQNELGTWEDLEKFLGFSSGKGVKQAIKNYKKQYLEYVPTAFATEQLSIWINEYGYNPSDITELDKLSQKHQMSFEDLMNKYKSGMPLGEIKSEIGVIDARSVKGYVRINQEEVLYISEKCKISEYESSNLLAEIVELGVNPKKLYNCKFSDEEDLIALVLEEKYGGENK